MGQINGYTQLVCDRCKRTQFTKTGELQTVSWKEISRTDQNSTPNAYTLCPECATKARDILIRHDSEFNNFLYKPEATTTTTPTTTTGTDTDTAKEG